MHAPQGHASTTKKAKHKISDQLESAQLEYSAVNILLIEHLQLAAPVSA
jgi:hypothetical protein